MRISFDHINAKRQTVPCEIELEIDWQLLGRRMGWRAMRNKHRESSLANGLIKGRITMIGRPK